VKIRIGYEITYDCPQPTPMILVLSVHPSRQADLLTAQRIVFDPADHRYRQIPQLRGEPIQRGDAGQRADRESGARNI